MRTSFLRICSGARSRLPRVLPFHCPHMSTNILKPGCVSSTQFLFAHGAIQSHACAHDRHLPLFMRTHVHVRAGWDVMCARHPRGCADPDRGICLRVSGGPDFFSGELPDPNPIRYENPRGLSRSDLGRPGAQTTSRPQETSKEISLSGCVTRRGL